MTQVHFTLNNKEFKVLWTIGKRWSF